MNYLIGVQQSVLGISDFGGWYMYVYVRYELHEIFDMIEIPCHAHITKNAAIIIIVAILVHFIIRYSCDCDVI